MNRELREHNSTKNDLAPANHKGWARDELGDVDQPSKQKKARATHHQGSMQCFGKLLSLPYIHRSLPSAPNSSLWNCCMQSMSPTKSAVQLLLWESHRHGTSSHQHQSRPVGFARKRAHHKQQKRSSGLFLVIFDPVPCVVLGGWHCLCIASVPKNVHPVEQALLPVFQRQWSQDEAPVQHGSVTKSCMLHGPAFHIEIRRRWHFEAALLGWPTRAKVNLDDCHTHEMHWGGMENLCGKGMQYCTRCNYHQLSIYLSIDQSIYRSIYLSIDLSIYLFIYLSTYLPIYLSTYLSIYLSTYLSTDLPIYLSTHLPIYPSTHLLYLSTYLPIYLPIYLSTTYLPIYLSSYLPIYLSTYLPIYLSTYLPIYLPTYLSIYLSTYLSIYLSIYLYVTCVCVWNTLW